MKTFEEYLYRVLAWSRNAPAMSRKTVIAGLVLCCLAAGGLRVLRFHAEPVLSCDGQGYVQNAEAIQKNGAASVRTGYSPHAFYGVFLSSGPFGLTPHQLGVTVNIILGSLLPLLFFGIAWALFGNDEIALWCAVLCAVHPKLTAYSIEVQRESPYLFFFGCFLFFAVLFFRSRRWCWNVGAALSAVLCFCFRYEGLEILPAILILYTILLVRDKGKRKTVIGDFCLFFVCTAVSFILFLFLLGLSPMNVLQLTLKHFPFFR